MFGLMVPEKSETTNRMNFLIAAAGKQGKVDGLMRGQDGMKTYDLCLWW